MGWIGEGGGRGGGGGGERGGGQGFAQLMYGGAQIYIMQFKEKERKALSSYLWCSWKITQ